MTKEPSHLEQKFARLWSIVAPDLELQTQVKNIVTGRRYVYDFCVPSADVLFEINGGVFAKGRSGHSSGNGIMRDADKVNKAQLFGYSIFVITQDKLNVIYLGMIAEHCRTKL